MKLPVNMIVASYLTLSCLTAIAETKDDKSEKPAVVYPKINVVSTGYTDNCTPYSIAKKQETRSVTGFKDQKFYKRFLNAVDSITNERFDEAMERFTSLYERSKEGTYDRAAVAQNFSNLYMMKEDYDTALKYQMEAVETKALPIDAEINLLYNMAYIRLMREQWDLALELIERWFKNTTKENPDAYTLIASAYYGKKDYKKAICPAKFAIEKNTSKPPQKAQFDLLLAAHWELKDVKGAAKINKQMVGLFPQEIGLWTQLASMYSQLNRSQEALAVQDIAYRNNMLTKDSHIMSLSGMFAMEGIPYKSAEIVEKAIKDKFVEDNEKNWKYVASMFRNAREQKLAAEGYGKAGEHADTGEHFVTQGQILWEIDSNKEAIEALTKGIQKGGLTGKQTGNAYLTRGAAKFNLKRYQDALADMEVAKKYKESRKTAAQWENFIKSQMQLDN